MKDPAASFFLIAFPPRLCNRPTPMPKAIARSKTKKSVAKRFKLTATGKVVRSKAGRRHLLEHKSSKSKRKLGKQVVVHDTDVARVKANLPFGLR